jgi:eukaryotic-like serine/threonine-protein kinase
MVSGSPPSDSGQAALARGATIGRYVILGLVGRGGMGEVYAAYDPELDRKVAVKLLRVKPGAGVSLAEGRQRTLREAQAIARLSHSNVVVVYDVGTFRDQVFIAMEFVEGNTVTYWVEAQARGWQEVMKVFMAAGRGLQAAHEKGLVHRDFKPDNVMVGKDGSVRVMDFGLARQVNERDNGHAPEGSGPKRLPTHPTEPIAPNPVPGPDVDPMSTIVLNIPAIGSANDTPQTSTMFEAQLTRTGAMMGTPAYMAPEQFLGTPTDARTDQFSFCVALYEALYRERPFTGNTMFALTSAVVQGNVRDEPANSKVPLWVRRVLLRGLRSNAAERWPSMADLLDALGKNPSVQRRKWLTIVASALLPVALGIGVRQTLASREPPCGGGPAKLAEIWELQAPGAPESPRKAQIHRAFLATGKGYAADVYATVTKMLTGYARNWANMHREACEAAQIRREQSPEVMDLRMTCLQDRLGGLRALTTVFSEANGQVVENAVSAVNALESLDRCADVPLLRAVLRPPEDGETRARVENLRDRMAGVKARFDSGKWKEAEADTPKLITEARALDYGPLVAEALSLHGFMLSKINDNRRIQDAERELSEAFWAADASRHDEIRAHAASILVYLIGYQQARFADSQMWAKTADAVLRRMGGHELLQSWLLNDLGAVHNLHGHREAGLKANLDAIVLKEKALGRDHPDVGMSENNVSVSLADAGRNQEALAHVDRAIALVENGLGAGHPDVAIVHGNRGEILNSLGRFAEARQAFERARVIEERELGLEALNLSYVLTGIGVSYLLEGNPASAIVVLERALKIRQAQEPDPAKRAETAFALARALWESNRDRARARALAEEAKAGYAKPNTKPKLAEVESWLRSHAS